MNSKLLGFALILSLMFSPVFAQLIEEETAPASDSGEEDLFGGDFISDLDSFLEEDMGDDMIADPISEDLLMEIPDDTMPMSGELEDTGADESFQSSPIMGSMSSGSLPSSAEVTLSVVNVSQDNADASQSGARPGDVLRYEILLNSPTEDVSNYVPSINVSGIESVVEFTNTGFGVRENGNIMYPAYSQSAPCSQAFTFFVRINEDCSSLTSMAVSNSEAGSVSVPLNCGLAQTGPSQSFFLMAGLMMILLTVVFTAFGRNRSRS